MVSMQTGPTVRAAMPAGGQAFLDHHAAARACLTRERRINRYYSLPGAFSLERKDGQERPPPAIADALGEVVVLHHIADLQRFVIDGVVLSHQGECRFMVEVLALAAHMLMRPRQQSDCLAPVVTALLAPAHAALRRGEPLFRL